MRMCLTSLEPTSKGREVCYATVVEGRVAIILDNGNDLISFNAQEWAKIIQSVCAEGWHNDGTVDTVQLVHN